MEKSSNEVRIFLFIFKQHSIAYLLSMNLMALCCTSMPHSSFHVLDVVLLFVRCHLCWTCSLLHGWIFVSEFSLQKLLVRRDVVMISRQPNMGLL